MRMKDFKSSRCSGVMGRWRREGRDFFLVGVGEGGGAALDCLRDFLGFCFFGMVGSAGGAGCGVASGRG